MQLLLDENLSPKWERPLAGIFQEHRFSSVSKVGFGGSDDVDLFPLVAAGGWQGLITGDINQLHRPHEREAIRDAGLTWIGIESKKVSGSAGPRLQLATLIAGLALLGEDLQATQAYVLHHVGHSRETRVHTEPL